jgi:hypothetical protein
MNIISKAITSALDAILNKLDPDNVNLGTTLCEKKVVNRNPLDLKSPNLFLNKIIDDGSVKCEVVDIHKTNIHVKILEINWPHLGTYLDVGKTYPVFKHSGMYKDLEVWEIAPKHLKRCSSQVIFQWEEGIGWVWDIDC